jgi:CRISPR-associated protein Cas1
MYFKGFAKCIRRQGFEFKGRVRQPPTDKVNALLSLGYSLLYSEVRSWVAASGLDPYLGCLHSVEYGKPSLALDLMEEWRPILIDALVLSLINLKILDEMDFEVSLPADEDEEEAGAHDKEGESRDPCETELPVKLSEGGLKKFLVQYEKKMNSTVRHHLSGKHITYRDCIAEQIRHFARYLKNEDERYIPFTIR